MVVTIFRSRLRSEHKAEYVEVGRRMFELASAMPGFVAFKTFVADDGERVSIVEFDSQESHDAWRNHPDHRVAQGLGREKFYADYRIQVCTGVRTRDFRFDGAED
ncbi:MAG: antibiotic biosynthesis monooxygenase family protein [Gemmatimonadales bacterium]